MKKMTMAAVVLAITMMTSVAACTSENNTATTVAAASDVAWMDYTKGIAAAKQAQKPVMIDFYTTWCKYCKKLDAETMKDAEIIKMLNTDFIAIKVDAEGTTKVSEEGQEITEAELARKFKVSGFPTLWFIDGNGEPIGPMPGYQSAEELKNALTFISSGAYAKGTPYSEYLESLEKK